jgi:hypothetical protein
MRHPSGQEELTSTLVQEVPMTTQLLAATQKPVPAGAIVQWGWVTITVANLLVILGMIVVFVLALLLPFPAPHPDDES